MQQGGRKLYKTKLCALYQRGRCVRSTCSFAHGEAELRDSPAFYPGRRDYNERFPRERRYSREPSRRFSPQRDSSRDRDSLYDRRNISSERGSSLSRSPVRRERRLDRDGSFNSLRSNSIEEGERETKNRELRNPNSQIDERERETRNRDIRNPISQTNERENLLKQIKQLEMDIDTLNDDKYDLELLLEDKHEEEEKLLNKIEDLELQLTKEQQESKRITSNLKKFVRAHNRYIKAQEELKRSQERMERLGELLGPEISKKEEDSSENVARGNLPKSPLNNNINNNDISSVKKRPFVRADSSEDDKEENSRKREKYNEGVTKPFERNNNKLENFTFKWGSMNCSASEENNKAEKEGNEDTEKKELKLVDLNNESEIKINS